METPDFLPTLASEGEELDVHLDVMAGNLLVVALGVDLAHARSARQPADAVAPEDARYTSVGDCDAVVAGQVPDDAD